MNRNRKTKKNASSKPKYTKNDDKYTKDGMQGDREDKEFKGYHNDASDYIPNDVIRRQVGSFSYNSTIGVPDVYNVQVAGADPSFGSTYVGAVMEIGTFTNIGIDADTVGTNIPVLGINAAALRMYNKASAENGKTTKWLPEDIAMAIVMVGEFVSAVAHYQRAYGTAFSANYRNRTVPKLLLSAMGFNPDNFFLHLSDSRLRINRILSTATNIQLPYDIKWFMRAWENYSHIFYDKGSAMGQYYVMRPVGFFKYYEDYDPSSADPRNLVEAKFELLPTNMNVDTYLDFVEDMLQRILESTLFNYVFTDIVRLMQKSGGRVLGFNFIPEFYTLDPEFSETFMNQVHNMSWGMFTNVDSNYKITDEPLKLSLTSNLTVGASSTEYGYVMGGDQVLDFPYTDNPDYDTAIDALAYKTIVDYFEPTGVEPNTYRLRAVPPHPVKEVFVHQVYTGNTGTMIISRKQVKYGFIPADDSDFLNNVLPYWESFDVKPIVSRYLSVTYPKVVIGNLNFWTSISQKQLARIFDFYFLGMFDYDVKEGVSYQK